MGPNDVITLRFQNGTGDTHVKPKDLARLTDNLCGVVSAVVGVSGKSPSQNELVLVGPPRRGSLLLTLQPLFQIDLDLQSVYNLHLGSKNPPPSSFMEEMRDWSMFFWSVVFGGTGVYQLYKNRVRIGLVPIDEGSKNAEGQTRLQSFEGEMRVTIGMKAMRRKRVVAALERLSSHAKSLGYTKIEICIRDDIPVLLDHD